MIRVRVRVRVVLGSSERRGGCESESESGKWEIGVREEESGRGARKRGE